MSLKSAHPSVFPFPPHFFQARSTTVSLLNDCNNITQSILCMAAKVILWNTHIWSWHYAVEYPLISSFFSQDKDQTLQYGSFSYEWCECDISLQPHLSLLFSKYYNPVTLTSFEFFKYISLHYVLDWNIYWAERSIIFIIISFLPSLIHGV